MNLRALGGVCFRSSFHSHFSRWLLFLFVFLEFSRRTEESSRNSRREKRIKAFCNSNAQSILLPHQDRSFLRSAGVSSCPMPDPSLYFRPVVGILTHPGDDASGRLNNATNASYIAASYVKFVESAGARVTPLIYNEPKEILAEELFKQALEKNDAGYHFPVLAICLGFELLNMIVSEDKSVLEKFNALDQASTLQFMESTNIEGTVFQRFSPDLLKKLTTECLVMQNHHLSTCWQLHL